MRIANWLLFQTTAWVLAGFAASGQQQPPPQSVSLIVTAEAKRGKEIPPVDPADLKLSESNNVLPITDLKSLRGSTLQLLLLIDNSSESTFDTQIPDIKKWIVAQPPTTEIAVAYMQNGMASYTHQFSSDHVAVADTVRLTMGAGGADVSPYDSLSDAITKWPATNASRREVLMISSGLEGLGGGQAPENPYVNKGISDAQKAGIPVYTIYNPSGGHAGHSLWRVSSGQNFLSQLSDQTGGESYITTLGAPVSFVPYLEDLSRELENQYLLTFSPKLEKKSGLQPIKIKVIEKNLDIAAPEKIYVKAST